LRDIFESGEEVFCRFGWSKAHWGWLLKKSFFIIAFCVFSTGQICPKILGEWRGKKVFFLIITYFFENCKLPIHFT
jgi:hypothetical protein